MEETLGKRIVLNRKRLGLTQDALAEQLGVTAQAVSKWENDQSCPDITMVPKLAQVFGITTDELLGLEHREPLQAEVVTPETEPDDEPEGLHLQKGNWEVKLDGGRRSGIGLGIWVLVLGGLTLFAELTDRNLGVFDLLWPSALLVFGLFGLWPRFSVFRLGCTMFGAYILLDMLKLAPFGLDTGILIPAFLLLAGVHLVAEALRKPNKGSFQVHHNGKRPGNGNKNYCTYDGEEFSCGTNFGEDNYLIQLPRLSGGSAEVTFGGMTLDLSGCEELAEGSRVDLNCSFGELTVLVPRKWRVVPVSNTAFGSVETKGSPDQEAEGVLGLECDVSFGEITIRYI